MSNFAENLRQAMKNSKMTGESIGDIIGVSKATVNHWARGIRTPNPAQIEQLSNILNVSVEELFRGRETSFRFVPLIGLASCGTPQEYALDGYDPVPVDTSIYRPGMYAVEAEGDSMSPKINHGDIVYCDPNMQVENGNIVHYQYGEESGIKKYKINESGTVVSLIPINTDYDPIIITDYENVGLRMARVVGSFDRDY